MAKIIIVGAGLAGSLCAKFLQEEHEVTILTKKTKDNSNSILAQGGIATSLFESDIESHVQDTLTAGRFINDEKIVRKTIQKGNAILKKFIQEGLSFDSNDAGLIRSMEGAHSLERILHINGDQTGRGMVEFVHSKLVKTEMIENAEVVDLSIQENRLNGVHYLDHDNTLQFLQADIVILATGGIGQLFTNTTNDETVSGDGLALCIEKEIEVQNLHFIQYHPTFFKSSCGNGFLISEAVRGEGARLVNQLGHYFMETLHPMKDLAPRDIVARSILQEESFGNQVYLDITGVKHFSKRFPFIAEQLSSLGNFIQEGRIPVTPAQHFHMGGVKVNEVGQTSVPNLYAIGEVAS
ncbi:MAG: FAD-binding protein, partial [Streptococcaceae bacterium]|nr:FAD-binding protein [Streptococcaceae bacterium]